MPPKRRIRTHKKGFVELANALGVDPGELLLMRLKEANDKLEEYRDCVAHGRAHPDLVLQRNHEGWNNTQIAVAQLEKEVKELSVELLPYRHPRLKSAEVNVNLESKSLADFLREANERRRGK